MFFTLRKSATGHLAASCDPCISGALAPVFRRSFYLSIISGFLGLLFPANQRRYLPMRQLISAAAIFNAFKSSHAIAASRASLSSPTDGKRAPSLFVPAAL
jgi:hypothetical protein